MFRKYNMEDLLQISTSIIGEETLNSVNARNIHAHLEVKTQFSTWIQRAIEKYDFQENNDYSILNIDNPNGGRDIIEYIVTLDMAKELAMLENNPKGKETRKYFIQAEKESKKPKTELELIIQSAQQMQLLKENQNLQHEKLTLVEDKIDYLENKSPVLYNQLKALEDKRKAKTRELVGYNTSDPISINNYSKTIRSLTKKFKDRFCISRYADLPKDKFNDAMNWLNNITLVDLI